MEMFLCILSSILQPCFNVSLKPGTLRGTKRWIKSFVALRCVIYSSLAEGDVRLWQSFLPQICCNKVDEGMCPLSIVADEPAWMNNYCSLTWGQGNQGMEIYNLLSLKAFSNKEARAMKRRGWGGRDAPRSPGNKRDFSRGKTLGENETIHPGSSVRALPQRDEMGTRGSFVKGRGWGWPCWVSHRHVRKEARL